MSRIVIRLGMGLAAILACYPIMFIVVGSIMGDQELYQYLSPVFEADQGFADFGILPNDPNLWAYIKVLFDEPEFFVVFWNSVKIVLGVLAGQLILGVPAAWGFAKYKFPFSKILFTIYVVFMMLPFQVLMLSEYLVLKNLNILDTLLAIILPGVFSTFSVFVLYYFFVPIPDEALEAARMDGAGELKIFIKIGLPLGKPGIASVMVLAFLEFWNLVEQPITFLKTQALWPLSIYFVEITEQNAGAVFATSVFAFLPSLIVFQLGQDYLEQGIAATAARGRQNKI